MQTVDLWSGAAALGGARAQEAGMNVAVHNTISCPPRWTCVLSSSSIREDSSIQKVQPAPQFPTPHRQNRCEIPADVCSWSAFQQSLLIAACVPLTAAQTQRKHWKNIVNTTIQLGFFVVVFFSLRGKRRSTSAQLSSLTWLIILIANLVLSKHAPPLEKTCTHVRTR